jgi:CheY-like chemotaxis protein
LTKALSSSGQSLDRSVRYLRNELIEAIEQLKPANSVSSRAKEQRPYALLYGRYVQGLTTTELVEELTISVRQLRREHKRALAAVTDLLWDRLSDLFVSVDFPKVSASSLLSTGRREIAEMEAEQLIGQAQAEDLSLPTLLKGVLTTLGPVAAKHQVTLFNNLPPNLPSIHADRVVLRQGLFGIISYAISCATGGQIIIEGTTNTEVDLSITARGKSEADKRTGVSLEVSRRLISSQRGHVKIIDTSEQWQVTVTLPLAEEIPILVIDDNAGLVELFRRYLAGRPYQLVMVASSNQAIEQVRATRARLIVLDIMMPGQDGWEVLQHLRNSPELNDIPIIICSVLNEPELAAALGASDYLPKPVTQDALLTKLEHWCGVPPASVE